MRWLSGVLRDRLRHLAWPVALLCLLLALYVSLGRLLLPQLAGYREPVRQKLQTLLQVPVQLGGLEGRWDGLRPRLVITDLQLGEGERQLRLARVELVPEVLKSLVLRQLSLYSLELRGLALTARQDSQGLWHLEGLPRQENRALPEPALILGLLQQIRSLRFLDTRLDLEPDGQPALSLDRLSLALRSAGSGMQLAGQFQLPDGQPVPPSLTGEVPATAWQDASLQGYLQLPLHEWAPRLAHLLASDWQLDRLQAGAELWFSLRQQQLTDSVLRLQVPHLALGHGRQPPLLLENLGGTFYLQGPLQEGHLLVDGLGFRLAGQRWQGGRTLLARLADGWQLCSERLEIGLPLAALQSLPLPSAVLETLAALQPAGVLRNLELHYRPEAPAAQRLQYALNLEQVSFAAKGGIPGIGQLSGSLTGDLGQGELRIDSRQGFSMHLGKFFSQPLRYARARGRLLWHNDTEAFSLIAPYLHLEGEDGQIAGDFLIRRYHAAEREDYMDLQVGMSAGDVRFTGRYIPDRSPAMSPTLAHWLETALQKGQIREGYYQYQGSLEPDAAPADKRIAMYFDLNGVRLAYHPRWPALEQADVIIRTEGAHSRISLSQGDILGNRLHDLQAEVIHSQPGHPARLNLQTGIDGTLASALQLLRSAPLELTGTLAGWQASGAMASQLSLELPLDGQSMAHSIVDFAPRNATLYLGGPALQLDQISGDFRYDSEQGLSVPRLQARLFGQPVSGQILATGRPGQPATRIEARSQVPLERLAEWLQVARPLPARGSLAYQLGLDLGGSSTRIQVDSTLEGVAIDLPAPFGKPASQARDLHVQIDLQGTERRYELGYADLAGAVWLVPDGQWRQARAELQLGTSRPVLPPGPGVRVRGRLAELDWDEWQAFARRYASPAGTGSRPADSSEPAFLDARLQIGQFRGLGGRLDRLGLTLYRVPAAWQLELDSPVLRGRIRRPDRSSQPLAINLDYLQLPAFRRSAGDNPASRADPMETVDPRDFPAMDISIHRVVADRASVGSWALKVRPQADGVAFRDLSLNLRGLQVSGELGWQQGYSRFRGRLSGQNLADVLKAWGQAPAVTSESFSLEVDGQWPGSPARLAAGRFSGSLVPRLRRGQFIEMDGAAQALRLFGLLNFDSIGRRLRLDFSDLYGQGLGYDRVDGRLRARNGLFTTEKPLVLEGPSANLELEGQLDVPKDQVEARLRVTMPITPNLPLAAVIVGAPVVGGALWVADRLVGDRVARLGSVLYRITGSLEDPQLSFDQPFSPVR